MPDVVLPGLTSSPPSALPAAEPDALTRREIIQEWVAGEPLVPPAAGLVAGIYLDSVWPVPLAVAAGVFLLAGAAMLRFRREAAAVQPALFMAAAALGCGLHDLHFRHWPANHVVHYCAPEGTPVRATGTLTAAPFMDAPPTGRITWLRQLPRTRLLVELGKLEGTQGDVPVSGLVSVLVLEPVLGLGAGDQVELFGTLRRPRPPANPGERDWALISRRNGVMVEMLCEHAAGIRRVGRKAGWTAGLGSVRRFATAALRESAFEEDVPGARLLDALVLGQRSAVDDDLNQAFINTGTVHYLSVSGAHVGALISGIWAAAWALRQPRRRFALAAIVCVVVYRCLAEPSPAITRATVMALVFCAALLLRRPLRSANTLAAAALLLLIWRPLQLFDPGFQLSFLTLLAIMFMAPRLHESGGILYDRLLRRDDPLLQPEIQRILNPPSRPRRAAQWLLSRLGWALSLSVSAWLVGSIIGACHFRQIAPWGWFNTVVIILPMAGVLLLGLVKTALSAVMAPLSIIAGWPLRVLTDGLIAAVRAMDRLPASGMSAPEVPAWLAAVGMASIGFWVVAPGLRIRSRWPAAGLALFAAAGVFSLLPPVERDALRLHLLAVGDGTACVVRLPGGGALVYDLGTRPPYDLQRWTLGPFLARERIYSVDTLVLSHAQLDHFCGVPDLLDRVRVGKLVTAPHFLGAAERSPAAARLIADLRKRPLPWHTPTAGQRLPVPGDAVVEVLWPPPLAEATVSGENNSSMVLRITYAGKRMLLCGDIEDQAQERLLATADLKADVLVLPHHGGVTRATGAFIEAVDPAWCLRSSGQRDHQTTNGLLELMAGENYLNTADHGAIEVRVAGGKLAVRSFRE